MTAGRDASRPPQAPPAPPAPAPSGAPSALSDALHLGVFAGFAVAQPLFEVLKPDATFFVARRSQPIDIVVFAAAVVLLVPLALVLVETAAGLVSRRLRRAVHVVLVAFLTALVALHFAKRTGLVPDPALGPLAAAAGAAGTLLYVRWQPARTFASVLSPAPLVFAALFLMHPTVAKLVWPRSAAGSGGGVPAFEARHPVVFVILDELPTASLLDAGGAVDPVLFPNFARLARASTWFRNASTSHEGTSHAIPCIMTGRTPTNEDALPIAADHPESVFTLLGGAYPMSVVETLTAICPPEQNERAAPAAPFGQRMRGLGQDTALVYAHIVLPESLTADLPTVTDNWAGFWKQSAVTSISADEKRGGAEMYDDRTQVWRDWVATIDADDPPSLYLHHALVPHVPWTYLHSGKRYAFSQVTPGLVRGHWTAAEPARLLGLQRHLLQTGYADLLLGELIDRLEGEGLWEDCLFVLVADHGVAFQADRHRRGAAEPTLREILYVPLFVKLPGQAEGRVSDRNVESIDVLPTVADALGVGIPWEVDGQSALDESLPERPQKTIWGYKQLAREPLVTDGGFSDTWPGLERRIAVFGRAPTWEDVYALGPHPELLGRAVGELGPVGRAELVLELASGSGVLNVDTGSEHVPSFVTGTVETDADEPGATEPFDLAIAVNGVIRGTASTFPVDDDDRPHFGAILPEESFQDGRNALELYVVDEDGGLAHIASVSWELAAIDGGAERVVCSDGRSFEIVPGDVRGSIRWDRLDGDILRVVGWAYDVAEEVPAETILVVGEDGLPITWGPTGIARPDLPEVLGVGKSVETAGFTFRLPMAMLGGADPAGMRAFAVGTQSATELRLKARR